MLVHIFVCCCYSDEDDGDTLDWLPMAPEIEDPEEPGWGQLEVIKLIALGRNLSSIVKGG